MDNKKTVDVFYVIKRFKRNRHPEEIVALCSTREKAERVQKEGAKHSIDTPSTFRLVIELYRIPIDEMDVLYNDARWNDDIWHILAGTM